MLVTDRLLLAVGQVLALTSKADKPYGPRVVGLDWQGNKLGDPQRLDDTAISQLLDRGERLEEVIAGQGNSNNPWDRMRVEVKW